MFSCDFYVSHIATTDLFVIDRGALRLQAKFLSIIRSYGWGGKTVETLAGMVPNLKVEVSAPVLCKGVPSEKAFEALDKLTGALVEKNHEQGSE